MTRGSNQSNSESTGIDFLHASKTVGEPAPRRGAISLGMRALAKREKDGWGMNLRLRNDAQSCSAAKVRHLRVWSLRQLGILVLSAARTPPMSRLPRWAG